MTSYALIFMPFQHNSHNPHFHLFLDYILSSIFFFLAKLPASSSSSRCDFLALLFSAAAAGELQNTWNDNGVHNRRLRSGIRTCGLYTTRGERKMGGME